jgi:5-methylcytosine-specific restriction endonuclease McrA
VSQIRPKLRHLRLEEKAYEALRGQILRRDGWRCQACGAMRNLEVHHKIFRSQGGEDTEQTANVHGVC